MPLNKEEEESPGLYIYGSKNQHAIETIIKDKFSMRLELTLSFFPRGNTVYTY